MVFNAASLVFTARDDYKVSKKSLAKFKPATCDIEIKKAGWQCALGAKFLCQILLYLSPYTVDFWLLAQQYLAKVQSLLELLTDVHIGKPKLLRTMPQVARIPFIFGVIFLPKISNPKQRQL